MRKDDGVRRYHHTTVDIYFKEGEMKCRYCPLLETYSRNMCRRSGEYITDINGIGWDCPLTVLDDDERSTKNER